MKNKWRKDCPSSFMALPGVTYLYLNERVAFCRKARNHIGKHAGKTKTYSTVYHWTTAEERNAKA